MIEKCKKCKNYSDDSRSIEPSRKSIIGDYCKKYGWNLGRDKPWYLKENKGFTFQKMTTYPPMKKMPESCFENK